MLKRILCVDDEVYVLQAFERQFRKQFELVTALGPMVGLKALADDGPFAAVVSDLRMPVMDGIEFLSRARRAAPDTVRIMLTGQADLSTAVAAVNQGNIFQFLMKPCPADMLSRALDAALEQHRMITAERELLEKTLHGSVEVLSDILGLVNPPAFSRSQRIRRYVRHMTQNLQLPDAWQFELAAMLSQIGCITVPLEILDKFHSGLCLTPQEQEVLSSQTMIGHKLLVRIPRLEIVAQMIAGQGQARPERATNADPAAVGAQLLRIAFDLDEEIMRGKKMSAVLGWMRIVKTYNPVFVDALQDVEVAEAQSESRLVTMEDLRPRMIISADVRTQDGRLLLSKGLEITESAIACLKSYAMNIGIAEPLSVIMPGMEPGAGSSAGVAAIPEGLRSTSH
jgi:ActR/RegA family two-component response regulator